MSKKLVSLSLLVALVFTLFPLAIMAAPITTVSEVVVAQVVTATETVTETQVTTATESVTKTEVAPVAKTEEVTTTTTATKTEEVAPVAKTESVTKTEVAPASQGGGETYTIQKDDWLSKIAEKKYNDVMAYKAIVKYNNDKAVADKAFTKIENPDVIEIGWTIYLPTADEVKAFTPTAPVVAPTAPVTTTEVATKTEVAPAAPVTKTEVETKTEVAPAAPVTTTEVATKTEVAPAAPVTTTEVATKTETAKDVLAPEKGRSRLFLFNEYKDELTFSINGKEYKVPVGGFDKMVTVDLDAGKYTYTISIPGGAVNGEVDMAPDQSWSVGVRADGAVYNPMQVYPQK